MNNPSIRSIRSGLTGAVNLEILSSIIGQLSDGKWENTPSMRKYWEHTNISESKLLNEIHVVIDPDDRGFYGMSDEKVLAKFAGWIKAIVKDEGLDWDRMNPVFSSYLGGCRTKVSVADAYRAYDVLKGRKQKHYAETLSPAERRQMAIDEKDAEIKQAEKDLLEASHRLGELQAERDNL